LEINRFHIYIKDMSKGKDDSVGRHLKQSWWVFLFLAISSFFYFHGMYEKNLAYRELTLRFTELEQEKTIALSEREELQLQIASQTDPAWIQMMLMKELGMIPEGKSKVYFKTSSKKSE